MVQKAVFSWSGGKDSTLALYEIKKTKAYEVLRLMTTVTEEYDRVSIHGVRRTLLEEQAASLGFPIDVVLISRSISDVEYGLKMEGILSKYSAARASSIVFRDIFLEDVRGYREDNLSKVGMKGIFPNWKKDTRMLAETFIDLGFKAIITCVDSKALEEKFVGRVFDEQFLSDLPSSVDPCGENGEFHSFTYDGPIFQRRIRFETGEIVFREGRFYYCDLLPD